MPYYNYEPVGTRLFRKLADDLSSGKSTVLLGPRHSGKRYTVRQVAHMLEKGRTPGTLLELDSGIRTAAELAARITAAAGQGEGVEIFDAIDRHWHSQRRPFLLLVPNLDILPQALIQRFLQGVRTRVEQRTLVVLLGGDQQFRDFVHGPNSEFNCTNEYVLQGFDESEFSTLVSRYAARLTFEIGPESRRELWIATGGQPLPLKVLLDQAVEQRAKEAVAPNSAMTADEVKKPPHPLASSNSALVQMFAATDESLRRSPEVWADLETLMTNRDAVVAAPPEPGALELSGLATRGSKNQLHMSSPLARAYAELQFTPRRLADLHGVAGMWTAAFVRYSALDEEQWLRPQTARDRLEIEQVLRSLANYLASEEDPKIVLTYFAAGARFLLGFREVSHWMQNGPWKRHSGEFPAAKEYAFSQSLPLDATNQSKLLDLPQPWSRCALAAMLCAPGEDLPWIICLSDAAADRAISRDRLNLARDFFGSFLAAYDHAGQIQFLKRQLAIKERCVTILDSILDVVGLLDMDRHSICRRVAQELRKLDYHRVLLCLVDRERKRIQGIWDESDQKPQVDVARMTNWSLDDKYADLQPFVISSCQPFSTADASKEPLANRKVFTAAEQKGIAIVPILNRDGEAIGTIHVERTDRAKPSQREVDDLMTFGRRLALILDHSERAALLNKSLDRCSDPIAILDPSLRWRYANEAAGKLLGVPQGWRSWMNATRIDPSSPLFPHMARAMTNGDQQSDQFSAGQLSNFKTKGDRFHVSAAPLRDAGREINGAFLGLREFTKVQLLVDVVDDVVRPGSAAAALDALLCGMETMGHPSSRIWLARPIDGKERLVSCRAIGLQPEALRLFNDGGFLLVERSADHHSWSCIEKRRGIIFMWQPDGINGSTTHTATGLEAEIVTNPEYDLHLGKKKGDFWIDLPLFSANSEPLGKLSTHIPTNLDAQQFWVLQLLGSLVSAVIDVFFEHDRQHLGSIEEGYQKSLATISHHLMNRVIALDALHWRFQRAESHPAELAGINKDFAEVLGTITSTIRRAREFLKLLPNPKPVLFDLLPLCSNLVSSHLPESICTSIQCDAKSVDVIADRELISVAFAEILSNSRKALDSVPGGSFRLEIDTRHAGLVRVRFSDNGPGIVPEIRDKIFDDFFSSWSAGSSSTGLGLGWARRVMRAHKGDLVLDAGNFQGACFVASLPRAYKGVHANGEIQSVASRG